MSAIAGVLRYDEKPVDARQLQALIACPAGNALEAPQFWYAERIGLAHASAEPPTTGHVQPLRDAASGCVIVFDGRLDNREELLRALHVRQLDSAASDAEYALAAYSEWGAAAPKRLRGDFTFAIWNGRLRELLLANDPIAMRPLFYGAFDDRLIFASTLEQLLGDPALPRELDEDALLRYLYPSGGAPLPQTHYRPLRLMPGGHTLSVDGSRVRLRRYWDWTSHPPTPRAISNDDVDEFRALFSDAVRCRLRGPSKAGITLSGGLDSGAISSMAGYLHRDAGVAPLRAYSIVFDKFVSCDERRYSQAASALYGFPHACVVADDCWTLSRLDEWLPVFTEPHFGAFDDAVYKVLGQARADGVRVMMTGDGGDFLVAGSPFYLADWLLQGRWRDLSREVRARASEAGRSFFRSLGPAIYSLAPGWVQNRISQRGRPDFTSWVPPHLRDAYHSEMRQASYVGRSAWWHQLHEQVTYSSFGHHNAYKDRQMRRFGMEVRQPFLDVRLIEFSLRTPPDLFYREARTKVVLREALRDILPPAIRDRRDKAHMSPLAEAGLRHHRHAFIERLLHDSELERRGYITPAPWQAYVRNFLQRGGPGYWPLWRTLVAEMWLRHLAGRLPAFN